jgi:hypothetical protein
MASILVVYFQFFRLQMATWKQKLCVSSGEEIFPAHSPFWPTNTRVSLFTFLIMSFAEFQVVTILLESWSHKLKISLTAYIPKQCSYG